MHELKVSYTFLTTFSPSEALLYACYELGSELAFVRKVLMKDGKRKFIPRWYTPSLWTVSTRGEEPWQGSNSDEGYPLAELEARFPSLSPLEAALILPLAAEHFEATVELFMPLLSSHYRPKVSFSEELRLAGCSLATERRAVLWPTCR